MMPRPLLLVLLVAGLLSGCARSKATQSHAPPIEPRLPPELAHPPSPDKLPRHIPVPANAPRLPKGFKMPPPPDLSNLPPVPADYVPPPLPPGVKWPEGTEPRR